MEKMHAKLHRPHSLRCINLISSAASASIPPLPLPTKYGQDLTGFHRHIPLMEAQDLERRTVGQVANDEWLLIHKSTLPVSNFHRIVHRGSAFEKFASTLFDGPC